MRTVNNPVMGSELVVDVMAERIREKLLTRPTNVKFHSQKDYGLQVSYHVAWLGVEKARGELFDDHSTLFDQLRWYSNAVMEYNPRSYVNLEFDASNKRRFNRLFISFKACIARFNYCCLLLFLDGTFLKERFKGNLLTATAKDGNKGLFPMAFVIVDSENASNWKWFLQNLANIVDGSRSLTFVLDRHVGLLESIPVIFPTSHHAFCMQHLQRNLKDKMKYVNHPYRLGLVSKLRQCAYASTVADFNQKLEEFTHSGRHFAINFLKDLDPRHWVNAYFRY
ncbi:uncharacterized protein LOC114299860 [Camellia sinensis]|uniref:uncharacterized protein LOC114299860 n=1 Tax=Camellia sinensis TaxID=4442 RepID=UPI0010355861|nr:uncharacterized protein LOC114299860 [Camellia sinensis]